jgi:cell division septal protein FtsQ
LRFYQIAILLLSLVLAYFFFFFNYFQIKKTVLINQKFVSEEEINKIVNPILDQRRFLVFPGKNIFLVNKDLIKSSLFDQIPQINSIEISKKYPDILKIKVNEMEPVALWLSQGRRYLIDEEGVVRGELQITEENNPSVSTNLFKIVDQSNKEVHLKDGVVFPKHINFINALYEKLPSMGINIKEIILPSPQAFEIHIKTDKDWQIYFILEKSIDLQLFNLKLVLEKELQNKTDGLDYIDLRVENWVYYKKKMPGEPKPVEPVKISEEKQTEEIKNEQPQ